VLHSSLLHFGCIPPPLISLSIYAQIFRLFSCSRTGFIRINSFKAQFCLVLRTLRDVRIKQLGLFSNTPKCDTPFHGAGVAKSTVMEQHQVCWVRDSISNVMGPARPINLCKPFFQIQIIEKFKITITKIGS
jgi:hypothetical protein